ncbi:MAG TPA: hypothetical protein V6C72_03770 [Chroococcales cyanobacterium]
MRNILNTRSTSLVLAGAMALVTLAPAFAAKPAVVTNKTAKVCTSKKAHKARTPQKKAAPLAIKKAK